MKLPARRSMAIAALVAVPLVVIVINFSETATIYSCNGTYTNDSGNKEESISIKLTKYRWWVSLWNRKTDGNAVVESKGAMQQFHPFIRFTANSVLINKDQDANTPPSFGNVALLSLLSGQVSVKTFDGHFSGKCSEVQ